MNNRLPSSTRLRRTFDVTRSVPYLCMVILAAVPALASAQLEGATAGFYLATSTDSENTKSRHYTVTRYIDTSCTKPKRRAKLLRKKYAKRSYEFAAIEIPVSRPFIFQVNYQEQRRDSERLCSSLVGFTPQLGRLYRAEYQVSAQVSRCEISLFDITEGKRRIDAEVRPEFSCSKKGTRANRNGVPSHRFIERF